MVDNKQFQQVRYATWDLVDSFRETNQAIADTLVTLQDRNLRFAQSLFLNWMEVLTQQTQSTQRLQQQWGRQTQKQQDAFQRLASASMQIYLDFLFAPFALSRQPVDATETRLPFEKELLW